MKVKTIIEMDHYELEQIVHKHYGYPPQAFSFIAAQECGNDSSHTFNIPKAEPIHKYDMNILNEWKQGKRQPWPITVLQDLVNNGVLAPGEYLIKVSW